MFAKHIFPVSSSYFSGMWKTVEHFKLLNIAEKMSIAPNLDIVRYKQRKGTRAAKLAKKQARKLADANKPAPIPKYLQRKVKVSAELERKRITDDNWLETQPIDNVYNMKLYRGRPYAVSEAIDILRCAHAPSLLNEPSALVYVTTELDLKMKKKTKFLDDFNGIVTFPNEFASHKTNKIIAICKDSEEQIKATDAGAVLAGSTTLIKQILSGVLSSEDFDYVICHPDMYKELNVLRGILKKKYPNMHNGLLRIDVDRAVASFIKGVEYNLSRSVLEPDFGWVNMCFGRLDMPFEQLEGNLKHALCAIEKHKPAGTSHILFNIRTVLWCEKWGEQFKIPHWEYLPDYPENGVLVDRKEDETDEPLTESQSVVS